LVLGLAALAPATEPGTEKPGIENRKDADDTARNERDRNDRTLTPMDQGSSAADRTITQDIRKAVVDNDELSTNAKNIKIITVDGVVTLRGPVKNDAEKTTVASIAHKASGVKRVDNQLEVERNP
jgi:osmotically-inducible protein OsmY